MRNWSSELREYSREYFDILHRTKWMNYIMRIGFDYEKCYVYNIFTTNSCYWFKFETKTKIIFLPQQ